MKELLYLEERPFCASKIRKIELGCEILFRATSIPTRYLVAWIDSSRSGTATRVQRGTTRVEKRNKRERERERNRAKNGKQRRPARFSIIRIYGNSVHVIPDNFRNGLLVESFPEQDEGRMREREHARGNSPPINYTERIVNAVKWTPDGLPSAQRDENVSVPNFHSTKFLVLVVVFTRSSFFLFALTNYLTIPLSRYAILLSIIEHSTTFWLVFFLSFPLLQLQFIINLFSGWIRM